MFICAYSYHQLPSLLPASAALFYSLSHLFKEFDLLKVEVKLLLLLYYRK